MPLDEPKKKAESRTKRLGLQKGKKGGFETRNPQQETRRGQPPPRHKEGGGEVSIVVFDNGRGHWVTQNTRFPGDSNATTTGSPAWHLERGGQGKAYAEKERSNWDQDGKTNTVTA
jgi:hypothetical protein